MKLGPSRDLVTNMCKNIVKNKKMDEIYGIYKNSIYRQIQSSWHPLAAPPPALNSASKLRFDNSGLESLAAKILFRAFLVFGSLLKHRWVRCVVALATTTKCDRWVILLAWDRIQGFKSSFPLILKWLWRRFLVWQWWKCCPGLGYTFRCNRGWWYR